MEPRTHRWLTLPSRGLHRASPVQSSHVKRYALEIIDRRTKATQNRDKAVRLNDAWGVGAVQARYNDDGHWYATLERFPAALFDAHGYVLFGTEKGYQSSPYLLSANRSAFLSPVERLN